MYGCDIGTYGTLRHAAAQYYKILIDCTKFEIHKGNVFKLML